MTSRYFKPGGRKAAAERAQQQAPVSAKSAPPIIIPGTPACLEIGRRPQHVEFDLSLLEHPLSLMPILNVIDYLYLQDDLLPNGGVIRGAFVPFDDEERSYDFAIAETPAVVPHSATLTLHLLERSGDQHVILFYKSIAEKGWQCFAEGLDVDARTWEFSQDEYDRLFRAAETDALERESTKFLNRETP